MKFASLCLNFSSFSLSVKNTLYIYAYYLFLTGYPGFQTTTYTSRSYTGIAPGYTYQFPGEYLSHTHVNI